MKNQLGIIVGLSALMIGPAAAHIPQNKAMLALERSMQGASPIVDGFDCRSFVRVNT